MTSNKTYTNEQFELLKEILFKNEKIVKLLNILDELDIPDYYLTSGAVNQTVLNYYHGYDIEYGIIDYDIVYFDQDTSYEKEDKIIKTIEAACKSLNLKLDIKNQARVHLWHKDRFGYDVPPYKDLEDALSRYGSTISGISVRLKNGVFSVYAPYGLDDLFTMTLRPIKGDYSKEKYEERASKWKSLWPKLKVLPWKF